MGTVGNRSSEEKKKNPDDDVESCRRCPGKCQIIQCVCVCEKEKNQKTIHDEELKTSVSDFSFFFFLFLICFIWSTKYNYTLRYTNHNSHHFLYRFKERWLQKT